MKLKLKIERTTRIKATNILGKVVLCAEEYCIYRPLFFGLLRFYLEFTRLRTTSKGDIIYSMTYTNHKNASIFVAKEAAERRIQDIFEQPDKYLRL